MKDFYCMLMYLVSKWKYYIFQISPFDMCDVHLHRTWIFSPYLKQNKIHLFTVIYWLILVGEMVVVFFIKVYKSLT
jgi:hypothetical protein